MDAKLLLIIKDGTDHHSVDKISPISVLLSITKMLEISILYNLKSLTKSQNFNENQRESIKSTHYNINDVFTIVKRLQRGRTINRKSNPTRVFLNFEKAYDNVPRSLLLHKL